MGYQQVGVFVAVLTLGTAGCARGGCVELARDAALLEAPYPVGYPSSQPLPNQVLRQVSAGRYRFVSAIVGHDYMVYKLTVGGTTGFVVADDGTHLCQ